MSFIRHRRATSPNKFECRNYDSKKNFFDTSAVEAVIKLVILYSFGMPLYDSDSNNCERITVCFVKSVASDTYCAFDDCDRRK